MSIYKCFTFHSFDDQVIQKKKIKKKKEEEEEEKKGCGRRNIFY
jgi:hypothetical protein